MKSLGLSIIRWQSSGSLVALRRQATTGGPMVILGTKWPSITSTWIVVPPPRSAAAIWSARRAKSADNIEGRSSIIVRPAAAQPWLWGMDFVQNPLRGQCISAALAIETSGSEGAAATSVCYLPLQWPLPGRFAVRDPIVAAHPAPSRKCGASPLHTQGSRRRNRQYDPAHRRGASWRHSPAA